MRALNNLPTETDSYYRRIQKRDGTGNTRMVLDWQQYGFSLLLKKKDKFIIHENVLAFLKFLLKYNGQGMSQARLQSRLFTNNHGELNNDLPFTEWKVKLDGTAYAGQLNPETLELSGLGQELMDDGSFSFGYFAEGNLIQGFILKPEKFGIKLYKTYGYRDTTIYNRKPVSFLNHREIKGCCNITYFLKLKDIFKIEFIYTGDCENGLFEGKGRLNNFDPLGNLHYPRDQRGQIHHMRGLFKNGKREGIFELFFYRRNELVEVLFENDKFIRIGKIGERALLLNYKKYSQTFPHPDNYERLNFFRGSTKPYYSNFLGQVHPFTDERRDQQIVDYHSSFTCDATIKDNLMRYNQVKLKYRGGAYFLENQSFIFDSATSTAFSKKTGKFLAIPCKNINWVEHFIEMFSDMFRVYKSLNGELVPLFEKLELDTATLKNFNFVTIKFENKFRLAYVAEFKARRSRTLIINDDDMDAKITGISNLCRNMSSIIFFKKKRTKFVGKVDLISITEKYCFKLKLAEGVYTSLDEEESLRIKFWANQNSGVYKITELKATFFNGVSLDLTKEKIKGIKKKVKKREIKLKKELFGIKTTNNTEDTQQEVVVQNYPWFELTYPDDSTPQETQCFYAIYAFAEEGIDELKLIEFTSVTKDKTLNQFDGSCYPLRLQGIKGKQIEKATIFFEDNKLLPTKGTISMMNGITEIYHKEGIDYIQEMTFPKKVKYDQKMIKGEYSNIRELISNQPWKQQAQGMYLIEKSDYNIQFGDFVKLSRVILEDKDSTIKTKFELLPKGIGLVKQYLGIDVDPNGNKLQNGEITEEKENSTEMISSVPQVGVNYFDCLRDKFAVQIYKRSQDLLIEQYEPLRDSILIRENGIIEVGEMTYGKLHGTGTIIYPQGSTIKTIQSDNFENGELFEKMGTITYTSGVYVGSIAFDLRSGRGTMKWNDGEKYTGDWDMGYRHGLGEMIWKDGSQCTGAWKFGFMTGKGEIQLNDGNKLMGTFEDATLIEDAEGGGILDCEGNVIGGVLDSEGQKIEGLFKTNVETGDVLPNSEIIQENKFK